jgi:hypothetical protein
VILIIDDFSFQKFCPYDKTFGIGLNYDFFYLETALDEVHFFEQYFTDSQFLSHFFRQENGRWQTGQI